MIDFEDLDLKDVLESVREELNLLYTKHEWLHGMMREFYDSKDFESETAIYLRRKIVDLNVRIDALRPVRDYLANMIEGIPFQVNRRVGRYMVHFGLTEEQAKLLVDTYREHRKSMSPEDKNNRKYLLAAATNVEWVEEEKCLHVHFVDEWWHYSTDGAWY
ncbi:hypothetical protein M3204_03635 [Mesobacillus subterraneus]|uniref:hypothetical protein n=1 Tax=Mesobacillus subterraneus TaxID=285983 RepID=UPI00203ED893|nr:hypothetical protein [Mesobacillus subterraneus]MCM3663479.1 hypothetical protein [Mesobacillus subterraneus]MCM3683249.1 hypothetical protein [Mesobacillus subterraneus]